MNSPPRDQGFWRDRSVLVTGGTGLVGSHLVRRLVGEQANVVCLVRDWTPHSLFVRRGLIDQVRVVWGDVCDRPLLERALAENETRTVFHLAAQAAVPVANRNACSTWETNVAGTWSLLEACRRVPTVEQIVVASSDKAYGSHDALPYDETTPLNALYPYDVSKACADLIARSYAHTWGVPVVTTRCGNFFGPGDLNWNRLVPGTIRSILRGQRPVVRSDGQFVRDYFYVEDGAAAYMLLAERLAEHPEWKGEAFNFSLEQPLTVQQLVDQLLRQMQSSLVPLVLNQAAHEIPRQFLSASKARRQLGWKPLYSLEQGLELTISWYEEHLQRSPCPTLTQSVAPAARSA